VANDWNVGFGPEDFPPFCDPVTNDHVVAPEDGLSIVVNENPVDLQLEFERENINSSPKNRLPTVTPTK